VVSERARLTLIVKEYRSNNDRTFLRANSLHPHTMELEELQAVVRERTDERSELSRGARQVGEDFADLPD